MSIKTINPTTGNVIKNYDTLSEDALTKIIDQSHNAYTDWSNRRIDERAKLFFNVAQMLLDNKESYGKLITTEMGKPIKSAMEEVEKCAFVCRHYAENTENYLANRLIKTEMSKSYVAYRPLGIIFAIMPWNFPFWQVFRFAAPSLMAGNTALLKHAPITTGCGLEIENIFKQAGFPPYVFQTVVIENDLAAKVIQHDKVVATTLTGSNATGKKVGAQSVSQLKKVVLELGGSDPYIILEDADLNKAAEAVVQSRLSNAGQSCIAAKRILAVSAIRDALQNKILEKIDRYKMGDPMNVDVNLGPMAREDLRAHLHEQIQQSVEKGAKVVRGGNLPQNPGFYYPPTVLIDVTKGMPAYDEELFGPVITFIDAKDEKDAIRIANETPFGLGGAVFTEDVKRGEHIAVNEIHAGSVCVNDFVRSDPRLPFGGIKQSGFGRELSAEGIHEFVNIKTITVK